MPQLDKFSFIPQILWLIIIYFLLYFTLLKLILPQIYSVIKTRTKLLLNLKLNLLNFGDKEILFQKNYIETVNYFIIQSNFCLSHLRYLLDTKLILTQKKIKNNVFF